MKKLLELLNEYHHFNSDLIYYGWDEEYERVYFHTELPEEQKKKLAKAGIDDEGIDEQRVYDEWICSKRFGFIEWLVDNDKIDIVKLRGANGCPTNGWCREIEGYSDEECLLMLLAIQNEPLIFLISILR